MTTFQNDTPSSDNPGVCVTNVIGIVLIILCVGIVQRIIAASWTELWFDEILSIENVRKLGDVLAIFSLHHDNNHPTNSLYLWLLSTVQSPLLDRALSLLSGCATVLAPLLVLRRSPDNKCFGYILSALLSWSLLLIVYSSEARGYSLAILMALLLFLAPASSSKIWLCIPITLIGITSHLAFLFAYGGRFSADFIKVFLDFRRRPLEQESIRFRSRALLAHLICLLLLASTYWYFYRHLPSPSAPFVPTWAVVASLISQTCAGPSLQPLFTHMDVYKALLPIGVACLLFVPLLWRVRKRIQIWELVFITVAGIIAPFILLFISNPEVITERYLLMSHLCLLILGARVISIALTTSGTQPINYSILTRKFSILMILCLFFLHAEYNQILPFLSDGRGHFSKSIDEIKKIAASEIHSSQGISIGGDHDIRIKAAVEWYRYNHPELKLHYASGVLNGEINEPDPIFLISHHVDSSYSPPSQWRSPHGTDYFLVKSFPKFGPSGFMYFLYKKR